MTVTHVQISQKAQELLIQAAAQKQVSVEALASEILAHGIQVQLSDTQVSMDLPESKPENPLAGLQPYQYDAEPEESVLDSDDWNMEN